MYVCVLLWADAGGIGRSGAVNVGWGRSRGGGVRVNVLVQLCVLRGGGGVSCNHGGIVLVPRRRRELVEIDRRAESWQHDW